MFMHHAMLALLVCSVCCVSASSRSLLQTNSGTNSSSSSNSSSTSTNSSSSSPLSSSSYSNSSDTDSSLPSDWTFGRATYYGGAPDGLSPYQPSFGTKDGGCGYGVLNKSSYPYWSVAALSTSNKYYLAGPADGCGECFEIECLQTGGNYPGNCNSDPNQRAVTVMITDGCPECEADHMDLQALTFEKIAPLSGGNVDTRYRRVSCTPPSNIIINIDSNSCSNGWLRLHVEQVGYRGSISLVQVKSETSGWEAMSNKWGAAWELSNAPAPPLDVRVQDDNGAEVTAFGAISKNCQVGTVTTGVQFSSSTGSLPTSPSAPEVTAFEGPPSDPSAEGIPKIGGPAGRVDPCVTAFDESTTSCSSPTSPSSSSNDSAPETPAASTNASASLPPPSPSSPAANTSSPPPSSSNFSSPPPSTSNYSSLPPPSTNSSYSPYPPPYSSSPSSPSSPSSSPSSPSNSSSPSSPSSSSNSSSPPSSPGSSSSGCSDEQSPGYSCSQQQSWGACSTSWMQASGWCRQTCGYC